MCRLERGKRRKVGRVDVEDKERGEVRLAEHDDEEQAAVFARLDELLACRED